jgi:hypothetical protein
MCLCGEQKLLPHRYIGNQHRWKLLSNPIQGYSLRLIEFKGFSSLPYVHLNNKSYL